jgi:hypothetical protein
MRFYPPRAGREDSANIQNVCSPFDASISDSVSVHSSIMGMVTRVLLTSCTIFLFPYLSYASFIGPVVSVLDGDTIEVLHNTHPPPHAETR